MGKLEFLAQVCNALWEKHGVIADDADEMDIIELWRVDNHADPIAIAENIAHDNHGI